jgi:CRISPR system Cascade subunit CasE
MYLSRVHVENAESLDRERLIDLMMKNAYVSHQLLWHLFPDNAEAKRDFLFREERQNGWPLFYLVSVREPQSVPGLLRVETKDYAPAIKSGDKFAFRLRANAVSHRKVNRTPEEEAAFKQTRSAKGLTEKITKKRKRDDVFMRPKYELKQAGLKGAELRRQAFELGKAAAIQWLTRQAASKGFEIPWIEDEFTGELVSAVEISGYRQYRTVKSKSKETIEFSVLDYEGSLIVTDPVVFKNEALFHGIGPAKAFGCGLLLVRRLG